MSEWYPRFDEEWPKLVRHLSGSFTTQHFQEVVERESPGLWRLLTERYGFGGKGSGNFFSPNNILQNYLNYLARETSVIKAVGFTPSSEGWGSRIVKQWELMDDKMSPFTEEDRSFVEGGQAHRLHLIRERAEGLRRHVIKARQSSGLSCDLCGFTGVQHPEELKDALFEVHHNVSPLNAGARRTTLDDVVLLCACCHRLLHRMISLRKRWITVAEANNEMGKPLEM